MPYVPKPINGRKLTIELLFSDLQIGKLMDNYDSQIAMRRVDEWIRVAMMRIEGYKTQGYQIEKIILAVLGDVIESDKKHENSGRGCDIYGVRAASSTRVSANWMRPFLPMRRLSRSGRITRERRPT